MTRVDATPLLRRYGHLRLARLARHEPAERQREQLFKLLHRAEATRFGRDHGFASIRSIEDFQAAVPLRSYEAFWTEYFAAAFPRLTDLTWPDTIPYFAVSSGTSTGRTKYIPVSREMIRSNAKAGTDLLIFHTQRHPRSRVLAGKNFMLGGSVAMEQLADGIHAGDLSGIARAEAPVWSRPFIFPSTADALEADWEKKIDRLARLSLDAGIHTIAGTPSWLLLFFERIAAITGQRRVAGFYPQLDLMVYGGMSFAPYRETFARWFEGSNADWREAYTASEGFIAAGDRGPGEGMRLHLDHGLFYEFVPVEELEADAPTRHWIGNAEIGRDYALVVSSCAGLWCYRIGDVVRLTGMHPPRLVVTGRTSYFLSAFGEHLSGEEIETAVLEAAHAIAIQVSEFSVGPLYPDDGDSAGRHLYIIEPNGALPEPAAAEAFGGVLDAALARLNEDYEVHRRGDYQLRPPRVLFVPPGTFAGWMKSRGKLGGQNKVPRVITAQDLFGHLRHFVSDSEP